MPFTVTVGRSTNTLPKVGGASGCHRVPKRRFTNQSEEFTIPQRFRRNSRDKFLKANGTRVKKRRNPEVFGQRLSLDRILETLDRNGLCRMIENIVTEHPEISQEVANLSPEVTPEAALSVLKTKLDNIIRSMPYKVPPSSDYSFLRVKAHVVDFFQALSDFTLSYMLPVETDPTKAIHFLLEILTDIFCKLPSFQAIEFKYYHKLTIDKFNSIFMDTISQFINERKQNILLIINENWLEKFYKVNELNENQFMPTYVFLKKEIELYKNSGALIIDGSRGDDSKEIFGWNEFHQGENDSGSKLQGLNSLLNFSVDNNPLNGSALGNVYDSI